MAPTALISSSKDANKSNMQENLGKWDVNATNTFFPKLTPITLFDERKYCSKQFSKTIIVCSFWTFIIKPK